MDAENSGFRQPSDQAAAAVGRRGTLPPRAFIAGKISLKASTSVLDNSSWKTLWYERLDADVGAAFVGSSTPIILTRRTSPLFDVGMWSIFCAGIRLLR